jgi:hypothetical protein
MANNKQRYINTRFWNDSYVSELDPIEKLLFIYFLTNEHTNISGIYEVPLKIIGIETGIDTTMVNKVLPRLSDKINYVDGHVVIKNFLKHQETGSENTKKGIINCLKDLDEKFIKNLIDKGFYVASDSILQGAYRGLIGVSNYLDSNLDLDSNSSGIPNDNQKKAKNKFSQEGAEIIKLFEEVDAKNKTYYNNKTERASADFLIQEYGKEFVEKVIILLPKTNQIPYMPSITKPSELKEKWNKLKDSLAKKQIEKIQTNNKYQII